MAAEVIVTPSVLNTTKPIARAGINVGDSSNWLILPVGPKEMICISFEGCSVPLYECLFTRLWVCFPFSDCEVFAINLLKFPPSQFHPGAWAYMKMFHFCVEHNTWKPSLKLIFNLFFMACTSQDDTRFHGLVSIHPQMSWFSPFTIE